MNDDFDAVIDGLVSILLGVYLVVVFANGNIKPLGDELKKEAGFLSFLVAAFILYKLLQIQMTRPIIGLFVIGAAIVAAQNIIGGMDTNAFNQYRNGQINLAQLAVKIFGA